MKFFKFLLALFLLPALGSTIHFGIQFISDASAVQTWPWEKMAWFATGFVAWIIAFFTMSRPTRLYVLGHELSHAIFVWLSGGKVSGLKIGKTSGKVIVNKNSALITLAPYIFPFYPVIIGLLWLLISWLWPGAHSGQPVFLFLWGASWSFHLCFTLSVMKTEQSDFSSQGYLFSFVTIFLCNAWILFCLLWLTLRVYTPGQGFTIMWHILLSDYERIGAWIAQFFSK